MSTCPWCCRVEEALDQDAPPAEVEEHLATCPACQQALLDAAGSLTLPARRVIEEPSPHFLARLRKMGREGEGRWPAGFRPEIPGFEVFEELGRGGMGVVYRARQVSLQRTVAVKVMHPRLGADPEHFDRVLRGMQALAGFAHPGIIRIYHAGVHDGLYYGVLEYVEGGSLDRRLANGTVFGPGEAARLVRDLAEAVQALHGRGLVHRDIKPANVLLTSDEQVKLADFGLVRSVFAADELTDTGMVAGTPGRMSPEQARGSKDLGPTSDVYALGVLLRELLAERGGAELEYVCAKCLDAEPGRRYVGAGQLAGDLSAYLAGERLPSRGGRRWWRKWRGHVGGGLVVGGVLGLGYGWHVSAVDRAEVQAALDETERTLYRLRLEVARGCLERGDRAGAWDVLERCGPAPGRPDWRDEQWRALWERCQPGGR